MRKIALIEELATAAGTVGGMIGGQVSDLEGEGKHPDAALLEAIHRAKTGALLRASLRMGGIYAGADRRATCTRCPAMANTSAWRFRLSTTCWMWSSRPKRSAKPPARTRSSTRSRFPRCMDWSDRAQMAEQRAPGGAPGAAAVRRARRALARTGRLHRSPRVPEPRMKTRQRLDLLVVERGLAESREKARALILAGQVLVNGQKADKAGAHVDTDAQDRTARAAALRRPRRVEAGGRARSFRNCRGRQSLPGRRLLHRRIHRLPAAARRRARLRHRRRHRPARLETAQRSARDRPGTSERALSHARPSSRADRSGGLRCQFHLHHNDLTGAGRLCLPKTRKWLSW